MPEPAVDPAAPTELETEETDESSRSIPSIKHPNNHGVGSARGTRCFIASRRAGRTATRRSRLTSRPDRFSAEARQSLRYGTGRVHDHEPAGCRRHGTCDRSQNGHQRHYPQLAVWCVLDADGAPVLPPEEE